jgi:hypothetical protein
VSSIISPKDGGLPAGRRAINAPLLAGIIYASHATHAFVEHVGARPGEGAVGAFAFERSLCRYLHACIGCAATIPACPLSLHWAMGKLASWLGQPGKFGQVTLLFMLLFLLACQVVQKNGHAREKNGQGGAVKFMSVATNAGLLDGTCGRSFRLPRDERCARLFLHFGRRLRDLWRFFWCWLGLRQETVWPD